MYQQIPIVCPFCGVGCNLELSLNETGRPFQSRSSGRNREINDKYLCIKGLSVHEVLNSDHRLLFPRVRRGGKMENVSWEEAIKEAASRLNRILSKYGRESVGMLCSGKILNEEAYLCQKFQRTVIGNNHIDNCARLCHGPSEAALRKQLGFGAVSTFMGDFDATETVVVVGANTLATYPIIWTHLKRRARKGEIHLVIADPRRTDLVKYAAVHIQAKPGTDIFWINALAKLIVEHGWHDDSFCQRHTLGFNALVKSFSGFSIDDACARAGITRGELEQTARLIRDKKTIFIWGMGLTQHAHGTDNVTAMVNLALLTGNIGKLGCGVSPLRGQNNVQGACDMGALPSLLPGQLLLGDEASRVHVGGIWNAEIPAGAGLTAPEMIHAVAEGKIRALYVVGENPVMSEPQSSFVAWMMQRLDLLIVQDIFPTDTSGYAHILFPAAAVGEKEGTFTNAARRVQYTAGGINPPGLARPDWEIIRDLADAMGQSWKYPSTDHIWEEIRQVAPIFSGISHDRLRHGTGVFWPCYDESHAGTPRLYEDGFAFRHRRARFLPVNPPETILESTADYPYVLITGRLLEHFNTGEMSRRSGRLLKSSSEAFVEMHPEDAQKEGLAEGDPVQVTSPFGAVTSELRASLSVARGNLFAPNHFNHPNFNTLMSSVPLDPQARMPALKVVPVSIKGI
jgi:formate dehydrogenase alpha subunit